MAAYGPRAVSPSETRDPVERQAQLLGRDLRHGRPRARPDVLHRRDDRRPSVRADPHPGVRGWAAAAVPDLAREADTAAPGAFRAGADVARAAPSATRHGGSTRRGSWRSRARPSTGSASAWLRRRSSSGSSSSLAASSSSRHSSPNVPSTNPGARNAALGPVLSFAPRLRGAHVLAGVQHLHRPGRRADEAVPAHGHDELAGERGQRPVGARPHGQALDGRVAVPAREVLLAARERAVDRPARATRELGGHVGGVAGAVLRAEAAAHVAAHDPHLVGWDAETRRRRVGERPRRTASTCRWSARRPPRRRRPGATRARCGGPSACGTRLRRRRPPRRGRDRRRRARSGSAPGRACPRAIASSGSRNASSVLPFDLHEVERRASLGDGVGRHGRDRGALIARFADEHVALVGADRVAHAGGRQGRRQVELPHACVCVRAAEHGCVEHPGKPDVGRVRRPRRGHGRARRSAPPGGRPPQAALRASDRVGPPRPRSTAPSTRPRLPSRCEP